MAWPFAICWRQKPAPALLGGVWALLGAGGALADPCHAIPDRGPVPAYLSPGSSFSGPVVYVGDGDSLCVDVGAGDWVEVRLADFYAPELGSSEGPAAKRDLERLASGRRVDCVAQHQSYDRVVAECRLNGRSLGTLLEGVGGAQGGRGFSGSSEVGGAAVAPLEPGDPVGGGDAAGPAGDSAAPEPLVDRAQELGLHAPVREPKSQRELPLRILDRVPLPILIGLFVGLSALLLAIWPRAKRPRNRRPWRRAR